MAILTTNISNVSLTVSGKNTQTATISWTCPTVPAGSTITSCRLTGNASSFTTGNKGATLTINNTSVSSGSSFTIDLGTGNNTTSVQASFVGAHKQTSTSVTLSNLVYTVEYTEPLPTYTVTFKDWDGSVLKTQSVESGSAATAPSNPSREGYEFIGWDKSFSNITSDLTVTAQYNIKTYTVSFYNDSILLKTETVEHGKSATAPNSPTKEGHVFIGWDKDFTNITLDLSIYAQYEINKYTVTFVDDDGTVLKTEEVEYGGSATAPEVSRVGYEVKWSVDFSNVTSDIITTAQYVAVDILKIKENGTWINIGKVYKRVSGNWVEQINSNWDEIFDIDTKYIKLRFPNPTAILYEDGTFIFSNYDDVNTSHGNVIETYTGWHEVEYNYGEAPWYNNKDLIKEVYLNNVETFSTLYWFYSNRFLQSVSGSGFRNTLDMKGMFSYCSSLTSLEVSNFDTSNVTNMESMFSGCSSLTSLDLSNFDTSNVTDISNMFSNCSSLTSLDVSSFDTNNVTNMCAVFDGCSSLTSLDLSNFDTSNVTSMNSMFNDCSSLTSLDVSSFDTNNVTNMGWMFGNCSNLIIVDLSNFDISKVTNISYMFRGCTSLQTIYVKDETARTKIEASVGFPTGVSVIIGKPN